jgi:dihydroxyacetone kinase-like protein
LTEADRAIGDGDHGVGMARGFAAVQRRLEEQTFLGVGEMLNAIGTTLLTTVGGAAGAIFGTFFRGGAQNLAGRKVFDSVALSHLLTDGLEAVQKRGGAHLGDKTMVDALEPAARRSRELKTHSLTVALTEALKEAHTGMENTKDMLAMVGKAKPLGARALGHPDPGAVSMHLILKYAAEYVVGEEGHA